MQIVWMRHVWIKTLNTDSDEFAKETREYEFTSFDSSLQRRKKGLTCYKYNNET